jgi:hypothetical protein
MYEPAPLANPMAAWLRGTRASPPTLDELEADEQRLEQLKVKVARLEASEAQRKQVREDTMISPLEQPTRSRAPSSSSSSNSRSPKRRRKTRPSL